MNSFHILYNDKTIFVCVCELSCLEFRFRVPKLRSELQGKRQWALTEKRKINSNTAATYLKDSMSQNNYESHKRQSVGQELNKCPRRRHTNSNYLRLVNCSIHNTENGTKLHDFDNFHLYGYESSFTVTHSPETVCPCGGQFTAQLPDTRR